VSVHVSSWAWRQEVGDLGAKLVLLKLSDSANDDGVAWPSRATLMRETECSDEGTIKRRLSKLRELGLLIAVEWYDPTGRQTSSMYLLPHAGVPASEELERVLAGADRKGYAGRVIPIRGRGASAPPSPGPTGGVGAPPTGGASAPPSRGASAPPSIEEPQEDPSEEQKRADAPRRRARATSSEPKRDLRPLLEALEQGMGQTVPRIRSAAGQWAKAAAELYDAGHTPAEVLEACERYRRHETLGKCILTPTALVSRWADVQPPPAVVRQLRAACSECDTGGGLHAAGCSLAPAIAAGE
jgi:hypothetical protein